VCGRQLPSSPLKSPGERGCRRSWHQLIRNACCVPYVETLCYRADHAPGALAGQPPAEQTRQAPARLPPARRERGTAPFSSARSVLQILSLLSALVRYQTYWLENPSDCRLLRDQASFNSEAGPVLRERTPSSFKTLGSQKRGENPSTSRCLSADPKSPSTF